MTLQIVAEHADVWNFAGEPVEEFRRKVGILREHCAAVGRDPAEITLSVQVRVAYDDLSAATREVQGFVDAGATHIVLYLPPPFPVGIARRLADEVIPAVRA